jgi:enamine deaminase RidA (YjgF/YER057c/UK114 family)
MSVIRQNIQPAGLYQRTLAGRVLYSHVVTVREGTLTRIYISGQLARNAAGEVVGPGDMPAQIEQVGENLRICLAAAGAGLEDLVKTTTYVTDIDAFFRHSELRMRYFGPGMPTSTTVEVRRLSHPDFVVEVEAEAVIEVKG